MKISMNSQDNSTTTRQLLVSAPAPQGLGDEAETGRYLRSVMRRTSLDFLYVFEKDSIDPSRLIESLQQVVNHYPIMAGRIASCGTKINLCNSGAAVTVAYTCGSVEELPQETSIGHPYCHIPSPEGQVQRKEPLLTVTLTKFQRGGCTLGIVISHLIADGWTFAMIVNDWSNVHNGHFIEPVEFHLPTKVIREYGSAAEAFEAAQILGLRRSPLWKRMLFHTLFNMILMARDTRGKNSVERLVLRFTNEQVRQVKYLAAKRSKTWISSSEAMLAHMWHVMLDAAGID